MARGAGHAEDDADEGAGADKAQDQAVRLTKRRRLELGRVDVSRQIESAPDKGPYKDMLQKALKSIDQQLAQLD